MSHCLGLRGATTADANTHDAIFGATQELLEGLVEANDLEEEDVAAIFFTTTTDLNAEFPALAARIGMGWEHTALMSAHEIPVPGATPMVIRALLWVNTDRSKQELVHLYLKGAQRLRARSTPSS